MGLEYLSLPSISPDDVRMAHMGKCVCWAGPVTSIEPHQSIKPLEYNEPNRKNSIVGHDVPPVFCVGSLVCNST